MVAPIKEKKDVGRDELVTKQNNRILETPSTQQIDAIQNQTRREKI